MLLPVARDETDVCTGDPSGIDTDLLCVKAVVRVGLHGQLERVPPEDPALHGIDALGHDRFATLW